MGGVKKHILNRRKNLEKARESLKRKVEEAQNASTMSSTSDPCMSQSGHTSASSLTPSSAKRRKSELEAVAESMSETVTDDEHIILKKSYLNFFFSKVSCGQCHGKLKTNFTNKFLDYKLDLECEDCGNKIMDPEDPFWIIASHKQSWTTMLGTRRDLLFHCLGNH